MFNEMITIKYTPYYEPNENKCTSICTFNTADSIDK